MTIKDPRFKNDVVCGKDLAHFFDSYVNKVKESISQVSMEALESAFHVLAATSDSGSTIYVCGNGGSASISEHLCCDWTKGTKVDHLKSIKTHSLVSNTALLTALANDFSYQDVFSYQLEIYSQPGDLAVLISSSGNSANIINAARICKSKGIKTIGMTGFSGGELSRICDISLHVPVNNYGIVEDCHQSLMHILGQYLTRKRDEASARTKTP